MSDKSKARAVQKVSKWSLPRCLQWVKQHKWLIQKSTRYGSGSEAAVELWRDIEGGTNG